MPEDNKSDDIKIEDVGGRKVVRVHGSYCRALKCHTGVVAVVVPFGNDGKRGPAPTGSRLWRVDRFFCPNPECGTLYEYPPGQPNARKEIEDKLPVSDGGLSQM